MTSAFSDDGGNQDNDIPGNWQSMLSMPKVLTARLSPFSTALLKTGKCL
jgi:hypothetical protein